MKLTIDSTEPLDRVLPVVGALYGVQVRVAAGDPGATHVASVAGARRARRANGAARRRRSGRDGGAPTTADVRAWARDSGYQVNSRGRVPASVVQAYRDAHR